MKNEPLREENANLPAFINEIYLCRNGGLTFAMGCGRIQCMIQKTIALTSSRQITLPSALIKMIGAEPGSKLVARYDEKEDAILLERQRTLDEAFVRLDQIRERELKKNPVAARLTKKYAGKTARELRDIFESSSEGKLYAREKFGA